MQILFDLIKRFEGCHKVKKDGLVYPYLCPARVPTQGWGTVVKSMDVPPITVQQAESWMQDEALKKLEAVLNASPILRAESAARQAAIASFAYNCGVGAYKSSTMKKRIDAGKWDEAAEQMLKWVWGGGRKLPGLILRRSVEAALLRNG